MNGCLMRSVIDHFKGNRDFPRLRIGIGRPPGKMDSINYVLRPFSKQEREEMLLGRTNVMYALSRYSSLFDLLVLNAVYF
ncbi:peptidyl-trna hydrolase [Quercus suber]|uniref:Peptidyl-trna hydrolase n=1 Tax=Quercus suber TaxID=58331 RepID=A0AAW0KM51_QUESU